MKRKISLLLAITMLLSGCNAVETAEQTTAEITTTTAETTVATTTVTTTTTTTTATTAEKQTSASSKETEVTKDNPNTPKSEVYLFDYHSFDEIAPSEEEQFEIFENVFYGEWESDLGDISFTYQDCYFLFTNSCDPTCLMEIDEGYVLPYIAGGVVCCFFVNKNDLSVMYNAEYDFIIGGITIREYAEGLHKSSHSYSKEISEGKLSSLGQMKLNSIIGGNFEECLNNTLDEKPIFTDIDGTEWIYGLGTYATPDEERRYLVSYSEDKVELGIRHFKKSEYDAYMDRELDGEPEEQYFVLVFEKTDGVWQYKNTKEFLEEINFLGSEETFKINPLTMTSYDTVFFQAEYDETYNSVDNPEMFDENGIFTGKEIYKSEYNYKGPFKKANKGDKFGNLTLIKTETHLAHLGVIDNSDIKTGVPGWSRAEFEGEVTLDGVLFYADENNPVWRGYMFIPFSSSLKENNLPMLHYYTNGWGYSGNNGFVSTSGRTTHFSLHHSETDTEKMEKILNGNDSAKVRVTLSDIYMYWTYDNGSGYDPYIANLVSVMPM